MEMVPLRSTAFASSPNDEISRPNSLRSSLDSRYLRIPDCTVDLHDDAQQDSCSTADAQNDGEEMRSWHGGITDIEDFRTRLKVDDLFSSAIAFY